MQLVSAPSVPKTGGTFTGDINVPAEAYDATNWNGSNEAPTKNDVRDKIETLAAATWLLVDADRATRTSGSVTLNSSTWANFDTGLDLTLSGVQSGDILRCWISALHSATGASNNYLDVATIVSGSPVNYISGGAGGASHRGVQGWSGEGSVASHVGGMIERALVSGDISSGSVTARLRYRQSSASARDVFATSDIPFHWGAEVYRPGP